MKRIGWMGLVVVLAALAPPAWACQVCEPTMTCATSAMGGQMCLGNGQACLVSLPCSGGSRAFPEGIAPVLGVTLIEESPMGGPPRRFGVTRGAGLVVGRSAAWLAQPAGPPSSVLFSAIGEGEGVTGVFRSRRGDGFTLRRDAEGRGAHVTVRALVGGRPGTTLADERLGEDDALVVRVWLDGRPCRLVVQAPTLPRFEAAEHVRRCHEALREPGAAGRPGQPPPFEFSAQDE